MPKLSVVLPVYREEAGLYQSIQAVRAALDPHRNEFDYELILVNDGSPDRSLEVIERLCAEHPESTGVVNLVRNFGQVAASFAGMARATGDCVAVISSDLQDPPELIPEMFRRWRDGYRTVLAIRAEREDNLSASVPSRVFYGLMRRFAIPALPSTGFDFFLLDQTVVKHMLVNPEPNGFLQGQVLYASGPAAQIPYTRRQRTAGESSWPVLKKVKYFIDGFVGYTYTPIRLMSLAGIGLFGAGIVLSALLIVQRLVYGTHLQGWTSIMIAVLMLHGMEMLMIGVIGEYLWRTLDHTRKRAMYLVDYERLPQAAARSRTGL